MTPAQRAVVEGQLRQWYKRYGPAAGPRGPLRFVREQLKAEPDKWQRRVLVAYGGGIRRISMQSCHGPGKTAVLAWIITHQQICRFPQKTACTAPTDAQLSDVLYAEVKKWWARLPPAIGGLWHLAESGSIKCLFSQESFASFRTARPETPEAIAGVHCDDGFVLLVADEASGVHEKIFESAQGSMSGHNVTTILAGNPVRGTGYFYDSQHKPALGWLRIQVSAIARLGAYFSPRPGQKFVDEVRETWGEDSNQYRVRVLGLPPKADEDTIIPREVIEAAQGRDIRASQRDPVVWGLDPAQFGWCETALAKRRGNVLVEPIKAWSQLEEMQVVAKVKLEWDTTPAADRPIDICVDAIGLGGGIASRLRELGLPARSVNVSEATAFKQNYANLRTELWFRMRDWFLERSCAIPKERNDGSGRRTLIDELASLKYKLMDSSGRVRAESKQEMKKRGLASPDKADALMLTFASSAITALSGAGRQSWSKPVSRARRKIV